MPLANHLLFYYYLKDMDKGRQHLHTSIPLARGEANKRRRRNRGLIRMRMEIAFMQSE